MEETEVVVIQQSVFGRWIIVNAGDIDYAWSGSRWVLHKDGLPAAGVAVSNYDTYANAKIAALSLGFLVV